MQESAGSAEESSEMASKRMTIDDPARREFEYRRMRAYEGVLVSVVTIVAALLVGVTTVYALSAGLLHVSHSLSATP